VRQSGRMDLFLVWSMDASFVSAAVHNNWNFKEEIRGKVVHVLN
jgi:hypothetical protein